MVFKIPNLDLNKSNKPNVLSLLAPHYNENEKSIPKSILPLTAEYTFEVKKINTAIFMMLL